MAEQTIDRVQVEIEASAQNVSKTFKAIESQATSLKRALTGFDTSKLTTLVNQLSKIQSSLSKINSANQKNSVGVNTSQVSKAEKDVQKSVNSIKQALAGLGSLKTAAIGGDSSSLTTFNRRVISIQGNIDVLREKLAQVGDAKVETAPFSALKDYSNTLSEKLTELKTKKDEVLNGTTSMTNTDFQNLNSEIDATSTKLDDVNAKMQEMVNEGRAYSDPFAQYRDGAEELQSRLSNAKAEVEQAWKPKIELGNIKAHLDSLVSHVKSAFSKIKAIASSVGSAFAKVGSTLASVGKRMIGIKGNMSDTTSSFKHGLITLMKYGLGIRSLYVLFRRLRKAITESFTELQKSGAMWQTTKANVEGLKTALSTLKFQFGAAFEPLFNTVAPALTAFINYLISLMNTISAFIAKLTGRSTYSKVAQVMNNTGSSAGSAAKATKELNKQLQNFDELNNISPENNSGGGGGGGGGSSSGGATYTEESVDSALGDFAKSLADAIEKGDWYKVGNVISTKLTECLNSIPWNTVFQAASDFGTNLADFLNGLITPDLFSALGTTIGNAIKTKLTFLNSFAIEFDWENFGHSLAEGLKSFVDTHPLVLAAETFSNWAEGITGTLATAINDSLDNGTINTISEDITNALKKINIGQITFNVGKIVSGLANSIYTIVSNKETWKELGNKIGDGISGFFESMGETNSTTGLNGWEALGKSISKTISGLATALKEALESVPWDEVGQAIADFIGSIEWGDLVWDLVTLAETALGALCEAVQGFWEDATWQEKVGAVIVGMIAVAKLTGLDTVVGTLINNKLQNKTFRSKIAGLILSVGSIALMGKNSENDDTIKGQVDNAFWDFVGAAGLVVGAKMLGFSTKVALKIGAVAFAWELGTDIGAGIGQEWANFLADEGIISREGADEYIRISKDRGPLGIKWWIDIGKSTFETTSDGKNRFTEAWTNMWTDYFTPLFEEVEVDGEELMNKFSTGVASGASKLADAWSKYCDFSDDIEDAIDENWKAFKSNFDDLVAKMKAYILQENTGFKAQAGVKYEYDSNGGVKYAYKNSQGSVNKALSTTTQTIVLALETKLNNGEISEDKFKAIIETYNALQKLGGKKTSKYNIKFGGDIASTGDIKDAKNSVEGLRKQFVNTDADYNLDVTGDVDSKDDVVRLGSSIKGLRDEWKNKDATMNAKTAVNGATGGGVAALGKLATDFETNLRSKWKDKDATMNAKTAGVEKSKNDYDYLNGVWKDKDVNFGVKFGANANENSAEYQAYEKMWYDWQGRSASFDVNFSINSTSIKNALGQLVDRINSVFAQLGVKTKISNTFEGLATGGVVTAAQFRMIGEDGAEAVVPLQNNLGWLSKMSDMMIAGMEKSATLGGMVSPPSTSYANSTYNGYGSTGNSDYLLAEMIQELHTQNELLEQILDKPSGITSNQVFSAVRTESRNFYQRTGNSPFSY